MTRPKQKSSKPAAARPRQQTRIAEPQREKVEADLAAFHASNRFDRINDYVERGRIHGDLSDEELCAAWKDAFVRRAEEPASRTAARAEQDFSCELEYRGLPRPYDEVAEAFDKFVKETIRSLQQLKQDREAWDEANERLQADLDAFNSRRDVKSR